MGVSELMNKAEAGPVSPLMSTARMVAILASFDDLYLMIVPSASTFGVKHVDD